jgi:hypothetical protein
MDNLREITIDLELEKAQGNQKKMKAVFKKRIHLYKKLLK